MTLKHKYVTQSTISTRKNGPLFRQPVLFQAAPEAPWLPPHCTAHKWLCTNSQGLGADGQRGGGNAPCGSTAVNMTNRGI